MNHDLYYRDDGLDHCKVCGGAEASLPSDCPGRRMTADEQDEVQADRLDYRHRKWWVPMERMALLTKYMRHVTQCEGVSFVDQVNEPGGMTQSEVKFTDDEVRELKAIEAEVLKSLWETGDVK